MSSASTTIKDLYLGAAHNKIDGAGQGEAIDSLLQDPYWTRTWIYQECILAEHIVIACGRQAATLEKFIEELHSVWSLYLAHLDLHFQELSASLGKSPDRSSIGNECCDLTKEIPGYCLLSRPTHSKRARFRSWWIIEIVGGRLSRCPRNQICGHY